ncbi:MAG: hypothetical protein Q9159_004182 [Coniocarpon cinnabarinum]
MGLPMFNNIHDPSVASNHETESASPVAEPSLQELIAQKDNLEEELKALGSVLDSHRVNMNTSLTTFDGYPRADIDVAQIRTTRARIIHLRNDHKDLMKGIEKGLEAHFASGKAHAPQTSAQQGVSENPSDVPMSTGNTFAKVNSVELRSPAEQAGLRAGDRIEQFGDADWLNNERLSKVAQIVSQSEGVSRGTIPYQGWGGRGLLGCHLVPE